MMIQKFRFREAMDMNPVLKVALIVGGIAGAVLGTTYYVKYRTGKKVFKMGKKAVKKVIPKFLK